MIFSFWSRSFASNERLSSEDLVQIVLKYYWTSDDEIAFLEAEIVKKEIEKMDMSLLWEHPRVTIQMLSELIKRLPIFHKERIWAWCCSGNYIKKNKVLKTLHAILRFCIKCKDRTAEPPSVKGIEKKLIPYTDGIRSRILDPHGMSLQEYNEELHSWILEPLFYKDNEIDALRAEVADMQNEQIRIQQTFELRQLRVMKIHLETREDLNTVNRSQRTKNENRDCI